MTKFLINLEDSKSPTINRTIRIKAEMYDKLIDLSERTGVTFNKLINQCINFALSNLDESNIT